jgi:SAM-dependent methyltransferase
MGPADTFERYAAVYDLLYQEKDYDAECDFLEEAFRRWAGRRVRRILDLGCGTAGHAVRLAKRGYEVLGVDRSPSMLAEAHHKTSAAGLTERLKFVQADVADLPVGDSFDAVICMFAVLSYQTNDEQLSGLLRSARLSLPEGGLFVADFWFGPAVVAQRPETRTKILNGGCGHTIRTAIPVWNTAEHSVQVNYQVLQYRDRSLTDEIRETHSLRYFFLPELQEQLASADFQVAHVCSFPTLEEPASDASWSVALIAQAIAHRGPIR